MKGFPFGHQVFSFSITSSYLGEGVGFGVIIWHVNRWGILLNKQLYK